MSRPSPYVYYHGQKGHYGVALLSRKEALSVHKGFATDEEDAQRRFIWGTFADENGNPTKKPTLGFILKPTAAVVKPELTTFLISSVPVTLLKSY